MSEHQLNVHRLAIHLAKQLDHAGNILCTNPVKFEAVAHGDPNAGQVWRHGRQQGPNPSIELLFG
jgi:hypothetical protein